MASRWCEKDTTGNSDHTEAYKILADTLTIDGANPDPAKRLEMKRIGLATPGAQPVVGVWQFMHYTGVPATWQYTSNGLAQLSVPFQTSRGRYTLSGSTLSLATSRSTGRAGTGLLSGERQRGAPVNSVR